MEIPFVDRQNEVAELCEALASAKSGKGKMYSTSKTFKFHIYLGCCSDYHGDAAKHTGKNHEQACGSIAKGQ
jgi:hypothetical protein